MKSKFTYTGYRAQLLIGNPINRLIHRNG